MARHEAPLLVPAFCAVAKGLEAAQLVFAGERALHGDRVGRFATSLPSTTFLASPVSGKPVAMILREGKTPSGEEVRTVLKHVIKRIRRHWPKVDILVRGDSHYGRDEAMEWCEETQGAILDHARHRRYL